MFSQNLFPPKLSLVKKKGKKKGGEKGKVEVIWAVSLLNLKTLEFWKLQCLKCQRQKAGGSFGSFWPDNDKKAFACIIKFPYILCQP